MYQRAPELGASAYGRETFHRSGTLLVPGELLRQPALAQTLERLTAEGSDFFYHGAFARDLCDLLGVRGGVLTPDDLAAYRVVWSKAVRGSYRGHEIATSGIPDGGLNIIEALNMVELLDLQRTGPPAQSPELLFDLMLIAQDVLERGAEQRDPHTAPDGTAALIAKEHAEARLTRLRMAGPRAGIAAPHVGTDHVTAADRHGNVAVMMHTHTSDPWVNGLFLHGVAIPASAGWLTRTPVAPGGRITIDGAENIAFMDGRPVLAGGSPSGSLLPCVLQSMINVLDFGMDLETSAQCPRFGFSGVGSSRLVLEATIDPAVQAGLERLGMPFGLTGPFDEYMGSFDAIAWDGGELVACPDPRRTGSAEGA
jgi:gamma-glutamyltranspeptidase / glutathione hydrolase